jgi:hypothetical protein
MDMELCVHCLVGVFDIAEYGACSVLCGVPKRIKLSLFLVTIPVA